MKSDGVPSWKNRVFYNIPFDSYLLYTSHLTRLDQKKTSFAIGPSELECHFVNTTLPLLDVYPLLPVPRCPDDQMGGIIFGCRGQRPCPLIPWTEFWGEPDHRRQLSFKLIQVLCRNQNGEVRDSRHTIRMLYVSSRDLEIASISPYEARNITPSPIAAVDSDTHPPLSWRDISTKERQHSILRDTLDAGCRIRSGYQPFEDPSCRCLPPS